MIRVLSLLALVAGVVIFGVSFVQKREYDVIKEKGVRAFGTVVKVVRESSNGRDYGYTMDVAWKTPEGRELKKEGLFMTHNLVNRYLTMGNRAMAQDLRRMEYTDGLISSPGVEVRYVAEDPGKVWVVGAEPEEPGGMMKFGGVMGLAGVLGVFFAFRKEEGEGE